MQAKRTRDTVVASATVQRTPRVSIVLSSYKGGGDHFGNAKFDGLPDPRAVRDDLLPEQIAAMTRHAIRLGNHPNRDLRRIVGTNESVLLLVSPYAEPVVVSTLAEVLRQEASGIRLSLFSTDAKRFPGIDRAAADKVLMPAPGIWSKRDVEYRIPRAVLDCDRVFSIAPLRIDKGRPSLTVDNYRMLAESAAGTPDLVALDLFSFHPAEFAILGGTQVLRDGKPVRHNLILAGSIAAPVDAVGAAVLGIKPASVPALEIAEKRGFGTAKLDVVWTLGNEIEQARLTS
ncbi:MAG TPA: hypothetical protein VES20_15105 [Bryobacteraceae bacterium]|nr:hypothetical protein [Bryobacteraceae bacterium]